MLGLTFTTVQFLPDGDEILVTKVHQIRIIPTQQYHPIGLQNIYNHTLAPHHTHTLPTNTTQHNSPSAYATSPKHSSLYFKLGSAAKNP